MPDLLESLLKIQITPDIHKTLPEGPGIYIFFADKTPIYIGKAINLKRRVSSYFDLDLAPKTEKMVNSANFLSFIRVESEFESLLLEARLIRKYMPHYNILAKDDKHPLYIGITKEEFPRVLSVRKLVASGYSLLASFGPFPSSRNVYSVLRMIRRIFPYSDHKLGKRACIYSHIGLCNPCPNQITTDEEKKKYLKNIQKIKHILEGDINKVKSELEKEMETFSKNQDFEKAAGIRDQITKLEYITKPQIPSEFFMQNPNFISDIRTQELKELRKILMENGKWKMKNLNRIECFDIAHLAGSNATASMVVFIDGEADKTYYRHFKIRQEKGQSDYDSMREVARRRAKHFADWGRPDLIIVDGGLGQVKSFTLALYSNEVKVPIVGIAKHPDHLVFEDGTKIKLEGKALNLVQRIRDEAHRFARRYHHHLISKVYKHENNT